MMLKTLRIQNLRCFKDETISLSNLNVFIGPNGAGKSTVLTALNIFFRESSNSQTDILNLTEEDFHQRETASPIVITVTFSDLSDEESEVFKDYVRLGTLIVTAQAVYQPETKDALVTQYGQRLGMRDFAQFFAKAGDKNEKAAALKIVFEQLKKKYPDLPTWKSKDQAEEALHEYESKNEQLCVQIPSKDQFYGYTKGLNRLEKYIQWVYVPAVKDALAESLESKGGALAKLLERTVRLSANFDEAIAAIKARAVEEYAKLLGEKEDGLHLLGKALTERLQEWAHPDASIDLKWNIDEGGAVSVKPPFARVVAGEGSFAGSLGRLGHGFQRSYIISLLQELATSGREDGPRLLLACEEPELYQHPPQARHLATVFQSLAEKKNQVLVCTHSPHFIPGDDIEAVRVIARSPDDGSTKVRGLKYAELAEILKKAGYPDYDVRPKGLRAKVFQQLQPQLNEMFFCNVPILVEGLEDVAYLSAELLVQGKSEEFRRLGCHFVHADGKDQLIRPLAICNGLRIPAFVIWDADGDEGKKEYRDKHEKDNMALLTLLAQGNPVPFPKSHQFGPNFVLWETCIGKVFDQETSHTDRAKVVEKTRAAHGQIGGLEKNALFLGDLVLALYEKNLRSKSLETAIAAILKHAESVRTQASNAGKALKMKTTTVAS